MLAQRATVTDCEAASGSWRLYAANLAWRAEAARRLRGGGRGGRDGGVTRGPRRGWSCVGRGILEHGWLVARRGAARGAAWHGAAWHGTARHGKARRGEARRSETRFGSAQRGVARRGVAAEDRSEGSLACSRAPLPAATCGRLLFLSSSLTHARLARSLAAASSSRATSCLCLSLRAVLLPSHREAASKQEPIWISVDLFLHSISLSFPLSLSLPVSFYLSFCRFLFFF